MKFKKIIMTISLILFSIILSSNSYSAADISNSVDSDIKVFGNWKVYLLQKKGKNFVFMDGYKNQTIFFRIILNKSRVLGYTEVGLNFRGWPGGSEQDGNAILNMGNKSYNISAKIIAHNNYMVTYLNNMPNNFLNLAQKNNFFNIQYVARGMPLLPGDPISLNGFKEALSYAKQLQTKI